MKRYSQSLTRVVHLLLVVALLLTFAAPVFAEGGPTPDKAKPKPFPDISQITDPKFLVQFLNEQFADAGVTFYVLQSDGENYHFPEEANLLEQTFASSELAPFEDAEKMITSVESLLTATVQTEAEEDTQVDKQVDKGILNNENIIDTEHDIRITSSRHRRHVNWYSFYCGLDAFGQGGILCRKNIVYWYTARNVHGRCRVSRPRITRSYLTGIHFLRWRHLDARANMINARAVRLRVWGLYILGISFHGIPIGATWNGRWIRTDRPPCSRYW